MRNSLKIASCSCGSLKAICPSQPARVGICNCTECQKRTGSVFSVGAYFPKQEVELQGENRVYVRSSDSGRKISCHFCPNCGTTVTWDLEVFPDLVGVAVGCFTDPDFPAPKRAVWASHKYNWVEFPDDVQSFPNQPS